MNQFVVCLIAALALVAPQVRADDLPDGKGKELILRACVGCHKAEEISVYRFTKDEYQTIVYRMGDRGAQATRPELDVIADYLFANFPKVEDATRINVNKATAQQIATGLNLTNEEAAAVVSYRERHGDFHAWGDLLIIYGVDGKKIAAAKDKISF
ncbi:MAG TPA: helix-hairpin-helix domain-containing protein [Bryobacteraceae bacterium]|nr:helix-hairpin-helix domain-containing protein [Bryobacteraceae bacterium]